MRTRSATVRAGVLLAAAGAMLLSGCGQQPEPAADRPAAVAAAPAPEDPAPVARAQGAPAQAAASAPDPAAEAEIPVEHVPTELPPGDPGLDAPSVPDPGRPEHDRHHEEPARTEVPAHALLDSATVSGVLGGSWQRAGASPVDCVTVSDAVAQRAVGFAGDGGRLQLSVATHRSLDAADEAVSDLAAELQACGWDGRPDPRLGTASAAATSADGVHTAVVVSAEGVTVTLVGSGTATVDPARWSSLVDLALGSSCPAAPEGCH